MSKNHFEKSIFQIDKQARGDYLLRLAVEQAEAFNYDESFYSKIYAEIERIKELDMEIDFLVAKSIAEILSEIDNKPRFWGMGCCSLVAYLIGITGLKSGLKEELDPIRHGLIFERTFQKGRKTERMKTDAVFGFYMEDSIRENVIERLKEIYGGNIVYVLPEEDFYGEDHLLLVNEVKIRIVDNLSRIKEFYFRIGDQIEYSTVGYFTEDYMHMLHYVFGFDYDETNEIRRSVLLHKKEKLEEYKELIIRKGTEEMPIILGGEEGESLFHKITAGIMYSNSKTWLLTAWTILNSYEKKKGIRE